MFKFFFSILNKLVFCFIIINYLYAEGDTSFVNSGYERKCSDIKFITFLDIFSENTSFQKEFTSSIVEKKLILNDKDNAIKNINKKDIIFPIFPSKEKQKDENLSQIKIKKMNKDIVKVTIDVSNNANRLDYIFKFNGICWYLTQFQK